MTWNMLLAGFGGQGILFSGKLIVYAGLLDDKEVSWLPSYGPEMRGGTANCSVIVSDEPVGSPLVTNPDLLMVMNRPSLDKFESTVKPGGLIICDSSLIDRKVERTDVKTAYVPATQMALDNGLQGLANVIVVGKIVKETGIVPLDTIIKAIDKSIPPKKSHLIEPNIKALKLGYEYHT